MRRDPMTEAEARANVAAMARETSPGPRRQMIALALQVGNLSDAARAVYRAALEREREGLN